MHKSTPAPALGPVGRDPVGRDPVGRDQGQADLLHGFFGQQAANPPGPRFHPEDSFDLTKYLNALRRRWLLLAACAGLALVFALVRYSLTEKVYKSTSIIQIERKRLSLMALGQAGWLEDWWNLEYYPTQYRLLRSRGMAERVVLNLRLAEDPTFNPQARDSSVAVDANARLAQLAARVQGGLSVSPIAETQLVELSYQSSSPELAARIANAYADVFIEWGIENRTNTVGQASSFLAAQIQTLNQEIEDRQRQLNAFTSKSGSTLDPAGEALIKRRQTLEGQYNAIVSQRIAKEAAYRELQSSGSGGNSAGPLKAELIQLESEYRAKLEVYRPEWPEMVELRNLIATKKEQLDRTSDQDRRDAQARALAEFQQIKREEDSLEAELRKLAADARLQNSSTLEYANQTTYIDTRKQLLAELVKRQSETEIASRVQTSQESNVRVVDRAIPSGRPFKPSLQADLSKALLFGLMIGLSCLLLLEYLDRTVKDPEELESILGLPTLAVIPDINQERDGKGGRYGSSGYGYGYGYGYGQSRRDGESGKGRDFEGESKGETRIELLPHTNPRLAVSEAYRSLRTALLLSSAQELRVVAVTSAMPSEGKTATTSNLAVVMAQLGRRVLIIDGDLRRPSMHKVFRLSNRHGLVNWLTANIELESLFFDSGVPNLWICPSGPIPPNPSELLASDRMREFVALMRQRFDFVLIDTPPTLPVADAVILGTMSDAVIVTARAGMVTRDDAKFCRERLSYNGLRVIGAVLNRYRAMPGRYHKKYRYYGVYEEGPTATKTPSAA
jgi:polysaccharide biosynthesis transport protein